jgi:hypothetical protein
MDGRPQKDDTRRWLLVPIREREDAARDDYTSHGRWPEV